MKASMFSSSVRTLMSRNSWTMDKAVDFVADLGITSVEHSSGDVRAESYPEFEAALLRRGITVACIHHSAALGNADDAIFASAILDTMRVVDDAVRVGAEFVMVLPVLATDMDGTDEDRRRALVRSAEGLRYVTAYAHDLGIKIVIENISRSNLPFSTIDDLKYLADNVPNLLLNCDFGNFICAGVDVLEAYDVLKDKFALTHLKDWKLVEEGGYQVLDGRRFVDVTIGTGIVPVIELFERFSKAGYDGWYVIESYGNDLEEKLTVATDLIKKYSK